MLLMRTGEATGRASDSDSDGGGRQSDSGEGNLQVREKERQEGRGAERRSIEQFIILPLSLGFN